MKHLFVFTVVFLGANVLIDAKSDEEACTNAMEKMKCCATMGVMEHKDDKECKKAGDKWECKDSKCVLEKRGLMDEDGEVNEKKFEDMMQEWTEKDPDVECMKTRVKNACLGRKYMNMKAPEEVCDATKFNICVGINAVVECKNWKNDEACKGVPEDAGQCKKMLDSKE